MLRYILFHHQTTTGQHHLHLQLTLRYILFHHQTTTLFLNNIFVFCCVISSFITKPQLPSLAGAMRVRCVISSFITKPQLKAIVLKTSTVALYPLSSPNHNLRSSISNSNMVALYPLSSPNHNFVSEQYFRILLRYILFHHQTTTAVTRGGNARALRYILFHHQTTTESYCFKNFNGCVISSFITKPQLAKFNQQLEYGCVISSFITKPQLVPSSSMS